MQLATMFTKTFGVAVLKLTVGIGMIALGHVDGGLVMIGSALGNAVTRDAITKVQQGLDQK